VSNWSQVDQGHLLREFLLPIWTTAVALALAYVLAGWATHATAFTRMEFVNDGPLFKQTLALVLRNGLRLRNLQRLRGDGVHQVGRTNGLREAWRKARQSKLDRATESEAEAAAERRLVQNAGLCGVDEDGRQPDQHGHSETGESIYFLAVCHMGHYRQGNAYRDDLLPAVEPSFVQYGLAEPFGVVMRVAAVGRNWHAGRRTITSHWSAIGAADPPPISGCTTATS
jgi:hypothetical protein